MRAKVCVITASGRRVCGKPAARATKPSGAAVPRYDRRKGGEWLSDDPTLTHGHHALPSTRVAAHVAGMARAVGTRLGQGNFGETFAVETPQGMFVVKLPAATNLHGQPHSPAQIVRDFRQEAAIANAIAKTRFAVLVPATTYVDLVDGTPALVREYGTPAGPLSLAEYASVEAALTALEAETGFLVHDDISLYRRADGSLYVGDVGLWEYRPVRRKSKSSWDDPSSLAGELERLARSSGIPLTKDATLPSLVLATEMLRDLLASAEAKARDVPSFLLEIAAGSVVHGVSGRDALGLPVPADASALARRYALVARPRKTSASGFASGAPARRFSEADARTAMRTLRVHPRGFTAADVRDGMNVEYEHRGVTHGDPTLTARIALDHLRERPDYYRLLDWMERAPRLAPRAASSTKKPASRR